VALLKNILTDRLTYSLIGLIAMMASILLEPGRFGPLFLLGLYSLGVSMGMWISEKS
jgi:uncharacterized membrane protein